MKVTKRNGSLEDLNFNKIASRIKKLMNGLSNLSHDVVAQKVMSSLYDNIPTENIDTLSAEMAVGLITSDPDYEILASRITASNVHKIVPTTFSESARILFNNSVISGKTMDVIETNEEYLNSLIKKNRDMDINYFGFKTLEKGYLQKVDGKLIETPQYMFLRVSVGIHGDCMSSVKTTYNMMSQGFFIHATPTLFNSGTIRPQMSSCFLKAMNSDSIDGIFETLKSCAHISKWAGGIGMHIHNIRANKSKIVGTNGQSDGIVPMLKVFNNTARYVNQGGKRKGSIAVYLEPWHSDIMKFLDLRLNHGNEEERCRDLFTALWIPDIFMRRLEAGKDWSVFCPNEVLRKTGKSLSDLYGDEFDELYEHCESMGYQRETVPVNTIWGAILRSQIETGTPYMLYKDACNMKSNQKNIGTIKSSNLCTEIMEVSSENETAVCNLASIALPKFVEDGKFNYDKLKTVAGIVTANLNKVIDVNFYPTPCAEESNLRNRPIGIGVQGLADVYQMLDIPFDSEKAREMNIAIFETIYYGAIESSMNLAKTHGPYDTFSGSPASQGILQFDMWDNPKFSGMYDWNKLKNSVKKHGLRNSLLVAPMPTASTSQILGNNECFEPYTTNIYLRRTLAGEFVVVNKHLVRVLKSKDMWNKKVKDAIVKSQGSVQGLVDLPQEVRDIFKTVWEISQKVIIDMARDRGAFVCQSQSMNLFMQSPVQSKLSSMHMYAWKAGLKTGMYYLRSKAKARPIQFTLEPCETCSA